MISDHLHLINDVLKIMFSLLARFYYSQHFWFFNLIIHFDSIFFLKRNAIKCHWFVNSINWLIMLNILNSDAFVFTRILRLKSKCNKTDATKKTFFKLLNAFFVADVISKFSKNFSFFDLFNISVKKAAMLLNLLMNRL